MVTPFARLIPTAPGPVAATRVTIDTSRPDAPPAPNLIAASDNGSSNSDNITGIRSPEFLLTTPDPTSVISLLRRPAGTDDKFLWVDYRTGSGTVVDPGPIDDGQYEYIAIVMNVAGKYSGSSESLFVTIGTGTDTGAPPITPTPPDLTNASDAGVSNSDNITKINSNLVFQIGGTADGGTIELSRGGLRVASQPSQSTASTLADPGPVPDGVHNYTVRHVNSDGTWCQ